MLLTAIIWSPIWILPSCSTALLFVILFTKIPEGSKIGNSFFFLLFMKITQINNIHHIHPLISRYKVLILRKFNQQSTQIKPVVETGQRMRHWFCLINTKSQSHTFTYIKLFLEKFSICLSNNIKIYKYDSITHKIITLEATVKLKKY